MEIQEGTSTRKHEIKYRKKCLQIYLWGFCTPYNVEKLSIQI